MTKIDFDEPSTGTVTSENTRALTIKTTGRNSTGILCENTNDVNAGNFGVMVINKTGIGIYVEAGTPFGQAGIGVMGLGKGPSANATGIEGKSDNGIGVKGSSLHARGVFGQSGDAAGVSGQSQRAEGVLGSSSDHTGVLGRSRRGRVGVRGECNHASGAAVEAVNASNTGGIGVYGRAKTAGRFEGDVEVTGDIKLLNPQNADCAEDFDIVEENVEPGTVMVLTKNGHLQSSHQEYDKKVAGIVSGAGGYKSALVLNRQTEFQNENQKQDKNTHRLPIALMGKVYCKVDANHTPIEIGDLLTTSSTKGYAMKADDPLKSFGAVLGKALGCIKEGLGMIPVLVTLQ